MAKIKSPDFTAYIWRDHKELDPGYLQQCRAFLAQLPRANPFEATSSKPQAPSSKPQAASNKHLTKLNKGLYRTYESKRFR